MSDVHGDIWGYVWDLQSRMDELSGAEVTFRQKYSMQEARIATDATDPPTHCPETPRAIFNPQHTTAIPHTAQRLLWAITY